MMKFIFWAVFLSVPFQVSKAQDACHCPASDPQANSKCGPVPAKLDRLGFERACLFSPDGGQLMTMKNWVQDVDTSKSIKATMNYMSCYRLSQKQFCHFKTTLGPLIRLSADSAKLPFAVQACLFKRESEFKPNALSRVGALGYIQFMPVVVPDVNAVVRGNPDQWSAELKRATADWNEKSQLLKSAKTNYDRAVIIGKMNYCEALIRSARAKIAARKVWDAYWAGTEKPPGSVTFKHVQCPNVAFVMGATKQIYDLFLMKDLDVNERFDGSRTVADMNDVDTSIFLAGAYNIGYSAFAKICGDSKTLNDCKKQFSSKTETYQHMVSIENCAKKDSTQPMSGWKKKDCEAYRCFI